MTTSAVCTCTYPPAVNIPVIHTNEDTKNLKEKILDFLETVGKVIALGTLLLLSPVIIPIGYLAEGAILAQHAISKQFSSYYQRPKAIILQTSDIPQTPFSLNASKRKLYKDYQVEVYPVSSFNEVNERLKNVCDKADLLIFHCHADSKSISLTPQNAPSYDVKVDEINESNVKNLNFSALPLNSSIIIEGCSAGREEKKQTSIARKIAEVAGGRKVFAPIETIRDISLEVTYQNDQSVDVKLYAAPKPEIDLLSPNFWYVALKDIVTTNLNFLQNIPSYRDVTASYQYSILS